MSKNILQFIGSFHQGGSERQAVQLTRLLHEEKSFNVLIAALNAEGVLKSEIESLDLDGGIPEFHLTSFYDLNFFRQLRRLAAYLREKNVRIIHTHDFYTNVFGMAAARLARVPVRIASKRETGRMRGRLQKKLEKQAFRMADAIVVNAKAVQDYLIDEGIPAKKTNVIYNGLDLGRLVPETTDRRLICERLGLPLDGTSVGDGGGNSGGEKIKFITLVANLRHEVKNQPMFLRAAQKVCRQYPNAHFVLAGEGELREGLQNLARELNVSANTHFIGRCDRVAELLSISSAGVLCSFAEGFSNSILEYMAASKPVVATDVGGAREAIREGETGFLVASNDDGALAERLMILLADEEKARKFGAAGRREAEENFSVRAQLERTLALYRRELND